MVPSTKGVEFRLCYCDVVLLCCVFSLWFVFVGSLVCLFAFLLFLIVCVVGLFVCYY